MGRRGRQEVKGGKDLSDESGNKKPSGRNRRVFERANDLGFLAGVADNRKAGQSQAHQQGARGFRNDIKSGGTSRGKRRSVTSDAFYRCGPSP